MYWQVTVTVNMHMHSRPTEQISTAHRYTSETQTHTRISPSVQQPQAYCLKFHKNLKVHVSLSYLRHCAISFGLVYFLPAKDDAVPVYHKRTHTHTLRHTKNTSTYLQTSSTGFLWPWWPVEHALDREGERREPCKVHSHHCGLPAA